MAHKDDLEDSLVVSKDSNVNFRSTLVTFSSEQLSIKLFGVSRKVDIAKRIICMAEFCCNCYPDEAAAP